ncbi:MAG: toll/interleukin-1 receptor domain-containing protein [Thiolinea sp.]
MAEKQPLTPTLNSQIFLSHADEDSKLLTPLIRKLREAGLSINTRQNAPPGSKEPERQAEKQIVSADQILFALSPNSVVTERCYQDIALANRLQKRIVPIVITELEGAPVTDTISRLRYIYLTPPADPALAINSLLKALTTNVEPLHKHTQLTEKAYLWDQNGRNHKHLLRNQELEQAEQWLATPPAHTPPPAILQQQFILSSRKQETQRSQRHVKVLSGLLAVSLLSGGIAWAQLISS